MNDNAKPILPDTKDTICFDDRFIPKIKNDQKAVTIRNSPVSLGYKTLDQGFVIEVLSCEKVNVRVIDHSKDIALSKALHFKEMGFKVLGFKDKIEAYDHYKDYIKRDFAYVITFDVLSEFERIEDGKN